MSQKFAAFNAQGAITAFYDDAISPAPSGSDTIKITNAQWQTCLSQQGWGVVNGALVEPAPLTYDEITKAKQASLEALIQQRLDAKAQSMNFDNLLSGIANASLPVGEYRQADGAALLLWRARTWQKATEIRDAYLAGTRPEPTWAEVEAELPVYPIGV